jgi:hypothetical protein
LIFRRSFTEFNINAEFLQLLQKICLKGAFFGRFLLTGCQKQFIIEFSLPMNTIAACPVKYIAALMVFNRTGGRQVFLACPNGGLYRPP